MFFILVLHLSFEFWYHDNLRTGCCSVADHFRGPPQRGREVKTRTSKKRQFILYIDVFSVCSQRPLQHSWIPVPPRLGDPSPCPSHSPAHAGCVLSTACAIALKDTLLTATGHCSPGAGWHTLMNDAALAASATAPSLTHEDT